METVVLRGIREWEMAAHVSRHWPTQFRFGDWEEDQFYLEVTDLGLALLEASLGRRLI